MSTFDSDQIILIFSVLFLIYLTTQVNRIHSYDDPLINRIKNDLLKIDTKLALNASAKSLDFVKNNPVSDRIFADDIKDYKMHLTLKEKINLEKIDANENSKFWEN